MKTWFTTVTILILTIGVCLWSVPIVLAAEHGGETVKEHAGTEAGGEEFGAADWEEGEADVEILLAAADELQADNPELASELRKIASTL